MNRKKKINAALKAQLKRKNAKLHKSNKPKYISKAEREKLALEAEKSTEETVHVNSKENTEVTD